MGGVAAVEAVAGRVSRLMETARVSGGPRAKQALTPTVLAMIGRNLIEWGESLHMLKYRIVAGACAEYYLCPAQHQWTVLGGTDPEEWIVDASLTGAQTVYRDQRTEGRVAARHPGRRPGLPVARSRAATACGRIVSASSDGRRCARDGDAPADHVYYSAAARGLPVDTNTLRN